VEAFQTAIRSQSAGNMPLKAVEERVFDLAELGARVVSRPEPPAARVPSPAAAAALEAEIDRSGSRESVARLALYLARGYASATALLLVHRGMVQGLAGDGLLGQPDTILFPADASSAFGEVAASGRPFRGAPPANGLDARILRAFGREHVQEIAILPVTLRGRIVSLLYADNGPEALGDASAAALTSVCTRVAAAYERLIQAQKSGALTASGS
jgi:hypothetical protein